MNEEYMQTEEYLFAEKIRNILKKEKSLSEDSQEDLIEASEYFYELAINS